jgi:hypothetical protein
MSALASRGRRRFAAALAVLAVLALAPPALAQDPRASEAQNAARAWLAYTDALDGPGSWQRAGGKFRDAMPVDRWTDALTKQREPRGKAERRTIVSTQFPRQIPGFEPGDYALVVLRTDFAKRPDSEESVTLQREADGVWRVVGYYIR